MIEESRYEDEAHFLRLSKGGTMLRRGFCVFALLAEAETRPDRSISEIYCQLTEKPCQRPLPPQGDSE